MKNFIFKSSKDFGLIKNVFNKLDMVLAELRHQRQDSVQILFLLNKILTDKNLQKQVDEYFDDEEMPTTVIDGPSPQTDSDEQ